MEFMTVQEIESLILTGRDDPPAGGVLRKLAGRSLGVANRHPSGTLLCLHVSKPGSDDQELTPQK